MKQIRLTKENEKQLTRLVQDSQNDLLTIGKAANYAIRRGLRYARQKFFRNGG